VAIDAIIERHADTHRCANPLIARFAFSADCMMQTYSGNTALSSPGEEIIHHRKGGWFLTYRKILSFVVLTVVALIVAGLIGWNIGTMPKTRVSDLVLSARMASRYLNVFFSSIDRFHPRDNDGPQVAPQVDLRSFFVN